jgi:hypothetical protein
VIDQDDLMAVMQQPSLKFLPVPGSRVIRRAAATTA